MTAHALEILLYVLSALTGLVVGSFLNVCIYRLPRGEFFSRSRSYCPKCGAQIKAYDNIPLFSYLILRGKCRACGERISPRYPLVEALTAALWVGNYAAYGTSGATLVLDVAACVLIVAAFVDLDTYEIPDSGIIALLVLGLITFAPFWGVSWQDKLIGCVCVSVPMFAVCLFGGMGFGDVKLYFVLGLLFGWQKILLIFLFSVVSGAVVSVGYLIYCRVRANGDEEQTDETDGENAEKTDGASTDGRQQAEGRVTTENAVYCDKSTDKTAVYATNALDNDVADACGTCVSERTDACQTAAADNAEGIADTESGRERESVFSGVARRFKEIFGRAKTDENAAEEEEDEDPKGHMIPFGPFIALATVVVIYCGDIVISAYKGLLGL